MTTETRTTIEPKDILGIEIECARCKCRCIRAMNNLLEIPSVCPNCDQPLGHLREEFGRLQKLAYDLRLLSDRQDASIHIRFEIANPPKPAGTNAL
jgi:hypothetical protein